MEIAMRVPMGHVKVEGDTFQELFRNLSDASELFGHTACGLCGGTELRYVHRSVPKGRDVHDYHEVRCEDPACGARLHFGCINDKSGRLYPRKKLNPKTGEPTKSSDPAGRYGPHDGWTKWKPGPGSVPDSDD